MPGGAFARISALVRDWRKSFRPLAAVAVHEKYRAERFAGLRRRAAATEDLTDVAGNLVEVERAWSVPQQ